jgi:hypothetical protein
MRRRGPRIFKTVGSQMAIRLPVLNAGRPLPPGRFLVLISVRGWVDPRAIVRLEGIYELKKNSNDLIGNRTSDLPACSIVPQPITLPRTMVSFLNVFSYQNFIRSPILLHACHMLCMSHPP